MVRAKKTKKKHGVVIEINGQVWMGAKLGNKINREGGSLE